MGRSMPVDRETADVMAGRICAAASVSARSECRLIELIGDFDAAGGVRWWNDVKSLAHWLSWCCSMSPGTAREHVRVARGLPRMPTVAAAFREGRLSYSKVREVTRVVGLVDEAELCRLALTATASQLARMVSGYRRAAGSRITQEKSRALSWTEREDEMVDVRIRLPKEEAAVLIAALEAAKNQFGTPPPAPAPGQRQQVDATPAYGYADAVLDVARVFLDTAPEDRSGEDRTLVVVHVAAEQLPTGTVPHEPTELGAQSQNVPAGTSEHQPLGESSAPTVANADDADDADEADEAEQFKPSAQSEDVPAGTFGRVDATCHIQGLGGIEAETARRLACDADVLGAVVDADGHVLAWGRTRRLVSRAQRRALMIRDGMCQYPHCHQTRHLQAHHRVSWADGGPTDLDNLILLCQWHHTAVHEGKIQIVPAAGSCPGRRFDFVMPDGRSPDGWSRHDQLTTRLAALVGRRRYQYEFDAQFDTEFDTDVEGVDRFNHPDAQRIVPGWRGEPFHLSDCVTALFGMQIPPDEQQPAEEWEAA